MSQVKFSTMVEAEKTAHRGLPVNILPPSPPGLEALYLTCRRIYPDQPNPLQVAALVKYWLGGPDPLDYISMYSNSGNVQLGVPPHWHYISFGLSDLHGDGRVHPIGSPEERSGFGFELTFRLKREPGETGPPTWPATLLQSLAKYVFASGNRLCSGDHVSWHSALDGSESRIEHMLLCQDPQLPSPSASTPCGLVEFVQVVGVMGEELKAAQRWNPSGVLDILRNVSRGGGGGAWLVTDMRRGESMLELEPGAETVIERGIETEGSNLSGVTAKCTWSSTLPGAYGGKEDPDSGSEECEEIFKKAIESDPTAGGTFTSKHVSHCSNEEGIGSYGLRDDFESLELMTTKSFKCIHMTFNLEAGSLLPLAIRGRVKHGRHFTFKSGVGASAITFVAETVTGTFVDAEKPFAAQGPWLQVLVEEDFVPELLNSLSPLSGDTSRLVLPKTFTWPERKLAITIVPDNYQHQFL